MSNGTNPLDFAAITGGIVTICGGAWGGVKWLFGRADRRERRLEAKEAELVAKLEARVAALEEDNRKIWVALGYVVPALHAIDPHNPALTAVAKILGSAFPIDLNTPPDMTDTLSKIR